LGFHRPFERRDREELVVIPATLRTHVSRAMVKLHARDRAQLVVFAIQSGLTVSDDQ
jgi:DNA-binding NarL/FixJ family response regulator